MKKFLMMSVVVPFLFAAGCGKEESAEPGPATEGKVEVERSVDGETREITIKTDEGTMKMRSGLRTPTEQELGVPFYPRATAAEGGSWSATSGDAEQAYAAVSLHSDDSIDLVSTFYQRRLRRERPQVTEMSGPQGKMVSFMLESTGTTITLVEDQQDGGTNIQITKGQ